MSDANFDPIKDFPNKTDNDIISLLQAISDKLDRLIEIQENKAFVPEKEETLSEEPLIFIDSEDKIIGSSDELSKEVKASFAYQNYVEDNLGGFNDAFVKLKFSSMQELVSHLENLSLL